MKKQIFFSLCVALLSIVFSLGPASAEKVSDVTGLIANLQVGEAIHYEGLTIIPVYSTYIPKWLQFITLEEALKNNYLEVTETGSGSVPQVKVSNHSDTYIYLMGGEILTGCKQDRIVGRDVLIGPKSRNISVTVYCVEHGRWTSQSRSFYSKGNLGTFQQRASAQYEPYYAQSVQSGIWGGITKLNRKMQVATGSDAYQAVYEDRGVQRRIASYEKEMGNIPQMKHDTIGVVIGIGGKIVSVDIFCDPATFKKLWPKLLKSAALSAVDAQAQGELTPEGAARFLRHICDIDYTQRPGIDEGVEFSAVKGQSNVNALVFAHTVIHIAAFPQDDRRSAYQYDERRNNVQERRIRVMDQE